MDGALHLPTTVRIGDSVLTPVEVARKAEFVPRVFWVRKKQKHNHATSFVTMEVILLVENVSVLLGGQVDVVTVSTYSLRLSVLYILTDYLFMNEFSYKIQILTKIIE